MIADLDQTIEQLVVAELPIKNGEIDVKFDQPTRGWSARLSRPTLNFFLYDVRENNQLRQHQWERMVDQNGRLGSTVAQKRTPFRMDCHYVITAWASEPQDEHRLLSRCLMALFRFPLLPRARLKGDLVGQPFDIMARMANHDRLTNPAELWGSLDNEVRPSISYLLTIAVDPWAEVTGPAVSTWTLRTGQTVTLPDYPSLYPGSETAVTYFGGQIRQAGQPLADTRIALKGTGFITTSNQKGIYILGSVPPGSHTLVVWPPEGQPIEKPITIPAKDYDIDL
ncbi:MAG: DUF4255 domain-containing protein [Chloroflexi bacterium]|nr:DUF4255 domain-containing protein [Chloroflexota bacterium]MBK7179906.1 DUF4255 domain-containing protein [Chloroflexota bacterium]MBP6806248.1 DUF4255 domain-containing protein [Chloroflexota bacterium]MBP7590640.1 DUF4255 domain-containing protein [Chloroflexota bacterium]